MNSLTDRRHPRVGILRGLTPSTSHILADARRRLPEGVFDESAQQDVREQASQEGWQMGYAEGMAAARRESADVTASMEDRYASGLSALHQAVAELRDREAMSLHEVADQTALLALRIAEVILEREIATADNPGREAISRSIKLVGEDGAIRIRMNPADVEVLGPVADMFPGRDVDLIPDPAVASGGCLMGIGATRIDAQIPSALARVAEVLR